MEDRQEQQSVEELNDWWERQFVPSYYRRDAEPVRRPSKQDSSLAYLLLASGAATTLFLVVNALWVVLQFGLSTPSLLFLGVTGVVALVQLAVSGVLLLREHRRKRTGTLTRRARSGHRGHGGE